MFSVVVLSFCRNSILGAVIIGIMDTPTPSFTYSARSLRDRDIPTRGSGLSSTPALRSRLRSEVFNDASQFNSPANLSSQKQLKTSSIPQLRDTTNIKRSQNGNNKTAQFQTQSRTAQDLFEKRFQKYQNNNFHAFASPITAEKHPTFSITHKKQNGTFP